MKVKPYLLTTLFLIIVGQAHAQINSDMQAMHMIKNFYTAYSSLNFKSGDGNKLDSLIDKYLTPDEGKKVKEGYHRGHDIMTNDSGINHKSLETMVIKTISDSKTLNIETGKEEIIKGVKDAYEVSYVNGFKPYSNGVQVGTGPLIDILVVKYKGVLKISCVANGLTNGLQYNGTHNE